MLKRVFPVVLGCVAMLTACGSGTSTPDSSTGPRTKNAALQVEYGSRWVGQKFAASTFKIQNLPACPNVAAPPAATLSVVDGVALLSWSGSTSTPPTDDTADMVVLERKSPTPATASWVVSGYTRTKANAVLPDQPAKGTLFRVSFYRSTATPCIGPRSAEVRWVPNTTS